MWNKEFVNANPKIVNSDTILAIHVKDAHSARAIGLPFIEERSLHWPWKVKTILIIDGTSFLSTLHKNKLNRSGPLCKNHREFRI